MNRSRPAHYRFCCLITFCAMLALACSGTATPVPTTDVDAGADQTLTAAPTRPKLEFSGEGCDSNIDPYTSPHEGILSQEWSAPDTLVVKGYVKTYCGGAEIIGDYRLDGDHLTLLYHIKVKGAVTACNCTHRIVYHISGLEQRPYSISLIPEE